MKRVCLALVALLALAGCAIRPGEVVADGAAPKDGPGRPTGNSGPPKRSDLKITDEVELVEKFLMASAADPATRENLMRTYVVGTGWRPGTDLKVVHIRTQEAQAVKNGDGSSTVTLSLQHVGTLGDSGQLRPPADGTKDYAFSVVYSGGELMLRDPPRELLLSDAGLRTYFEARPLYFVAGDGAFVPDLRYVSQSLSEEQKSNRLVDWLYDGASQWLQPSVKKLPSETRPGVTKVVRGENASLVIDLSALPADSDFAQLKLQLARTLIRAPFTSLTIKVQGQVKSANVTVGQAVARPTPARYVVVDGVVRRLRTPGHESAELPIAPEMNKNVTAVGFSANERAVALVQQDGSGQRLLVGIRTLVAVNLSRPSHIAQPMWLEHDSRSLLVQADEHIYQVSAEGKIEQDTRVPGLQAMSAFFDGRRLALVIDGALYLASRYDNGTIAIDDKQRVPTLFDTVQGVAFGVRFQLIVSGSLPGGVSLLRMNLDGSQQSLLRDIWHGTVSHIVSDGDVGTALFEVQGGGAFEASQSNSQSLYESIEWRPASPPATDVRSRISAPSFEG